MAHPLGLGTLPSQTKLGFLYEKRRKAMALQELLALVVGIRSHGKFLKTETGPYAFVYSPIGL